MKKNNSFRIIVCCYNVEKWICKTINSIKSQKYKNFICTIVDANSTDNTVKEAYIEIANDKRFEILINKERKFPLQNQFETIKNLNLEDDDIIVNVDGDDWFYDENSLNKINEVYSEFPDTLLTYGNFILYPDNTISQLREYPQEIIDNNLYRKYNWLASHLRTFKYKLFKNLSQEYLLSKNGKYFEKAGDLALMFPLLEMSGGKIKFVPDILYVYNVQNPLNENKVDVSMILSCEEEIRSKQSCNPIF